MLIFLSLYMDFLGLIFFSSLFHFPVISNCFLLCSCDLLRYDEGSLGLRTYFDEETGECITFVTLEDESLKMAQVASFIGLAVGIAMLICSGVHNFLQPIPAQDMLFGVCSMFLEVCLLGVYLAQNNGVCQIEGCSWGTGTLWLVITQLVFVAPTMGSWFASRPVAGKDHPWNHRSLYSSSNHNETLRRSQQKINLGFELGN
jgi:hypothetical protein